MASIFTYDPNPPRVSSPWLWVQSSESSRLGSEFKHDALSQSAPLSTSYTQPQDRISVLRLQAEPQEGPVEYKLHLLLRPRRKFRSTSTVGTASGSKHARMYGPPASRTVSDPVVTGPTALTQQNRQHRLEQLTTQLLWRLQQSSPHHTSSATNIILPSLPEALPELQAPQQSAKLLHGLEESQGALYEIGVSDDGTLVGLADDEMQESLNNLRAMAACLGCTVEVLRKEVVGDCEWIEDATIGGQTRQVRRHGKLSVSEALVKPYLGFEGSSDTAASISNESSAIALDEPPMPAATEELRVTLTGPTMSGKSTLLGTLTTSTTDNGRGKSRLIMLKHRHEITSGVTSSITQELLGYRDTDSGDVEVINYGIENIASWIDIHVGASGDRLVFVSDSAGHPRYRRTTVKGLVGWAPHWTLLCIPADSGDNAASKPEVTQSSQPNNSTALPDVDVSGAQLELCLRLGLPLVVVITKLDLASRNGLRTSLSKVLDVLKAAGRRPAIIPNAANAISQEDLRTIAGPLLEQAYNTCIPLLNDPSATVPIILTSAVQGTGISNLHALLHELPIPNFTQRVPAESSIVFHVEDVYTKPAEMQGIVVSGRLRMGKLTIGDTLVLGPFSTNDHFEDSEDSDEHAIRRPSNYLPASRSFPGAFRGSHLNHFQVPGQEWKSVKITSIRNLRLPVASLLPDQVGTLALVPHEDSSDVIPTPSAALARVRKGMVLASVQPLAARSFTAEFSRSDLESLAVGNHIVVYTASIRASAKVISARAPDEPIILDQETLIDPEDQAFAFEEEDQPSLFGDGTREKASIAGMVTAQKLWVTFGFDALKEAVIVGDQVLVMPGGGPSLLGGQERGQKGVAGLDGFVGRIAEIHG